MLQVILGSSSVARRKILADMGYDFIPMVNSLEIFKWISLLVFFLAYMVKVFFIV